MIRKSSGVITTLVALTALTASACGANAGDPQAGGSPESGERELVIEDVAGCETVEFQDTYSDASELPRCEPGAPAAQPLDEPATVTIAVPTEGLSTFTVMLAADVMGELEKENITLETEVMPSTDALQLLAAKEIDAMVGSSSVGIFNAIEQGFVVRQIIGDGWLGPGSKMGVWARSDLDVADMKGLQIASAVGEGSSANIALRNLLAEEELTLEDLRWESVDAPSTTTALENGAVDLAMVLDPFWLQLEGNDDFEFIAPAIAPGQNVGGVHAGPKLLEREDVARGLVRAYIRTVNTYFTDENWQDNEELVQALSERLNMSVDDYTSIPGQVYNWDIPIGAATDLQELYLETGTLATSEPISEDEFVDRSFIYEAVGQERR